MKNWIYRVIKKRGLTFFAGILFALVCFIALNAAMVGVSKSEYCGSKCHEMNTAYQTWELSPHGANKYGIEVKCIDCHLPSKEKYFTHLIAKAHAGAKDTYKHHFGGEYDIEEIRQKVIAEMTNEKCVECHSNLLLKTTNSAARVAHTEVLGNPYDPENKCLECHEDVGHERTNKLFSL